MYCFDEAPAERINRMRKSMMALQSMIAVSGLSKKKIMFDEMYNEKDALLMSTNFTLPRNQIALYELLFQKELEKRGVRVVCEVNFDTDNNVAMLIRFMPLIK